MTVPWLARLPAYCTKKIKFKAKCDSYIPARMGPMSGETNMLATKGKQKVFLPKPQNQGKNFRRGCGHGSVVI